MKVLICAVVFALVATMGHSLSEEQKERARAVSKECREKSGVPEDLVLKARQGQFTDDPKLKEHLYCFAQKLGLINAQGELQPEVIKAKIKNDVNADVAEKATSICPRGFAATM